MYMYIYICDRRMLFSAEKYFPGTIKDYKTQRLGGRGSESLLFVTLFGSVESNTIPTQSINYTMSLYGRIQYISTTM